MGFSQKIKYYLVHTLQHTNKSAQQLLEGGHVAINGIVVKENCNLDATSEVSIDNKVARERDEPVYLKFYKPAGFESTLNAGVQNNLSEYFKAFKNLAIAGRLDKASEGLLLLSNDGKWIEKLCNPKFEKEKEYIVSLDKTPDAAFVENFSAGVSIGTYLTKPCRCKIISENQILVVLREGKNRQIRRMCHNLGYGVLKLCRVRIDGVTISNLTPGENSLMAKSKI